MRKVHDYVNCLSPSGWHRMAYVEYGDINNPNVLICVHGLTRNANDFDTLAQRFAGQWRIICPDVVGRGTSGWLRDARAYTLSQYINDMAVLIARLQVLTVHWLGTSMGGLIGMGLASLPGSPLRSLIINDIGPHIEPLALERISAYVGRAPRFADEGQAEQYVRSVSAPFGPHTDAQWRQLTQGVIRPAPDEGQGFVLHYDPAIALALSEVTQQTAETLGAQGWALYDSIQCPTLLIRGEASDLLSTATADAMQQRGPRATLVSFAGIGHAPTLMHADQLDALEKFWLTIKR